MTLCERGDFIGVRTEVERGADVNSVDSHGRSGLMLAVINSHN